MYRLIPLVAAVILTACSTISDYTPQQQSWQVREASLKQLDTWSLKGRIAIRTQEDSWSGSLSWQQDNLFYDIRFSGPFGQGAMTLLGDEQHVVLTTSEGELVGNQGPEQLLEQHSGWRVPLANLKYWTIGRPNPRVAKSLLQLDEYGRLKQLAQSDWVVEYQRYQLVDGLELPTKMKITNHLLQVKLIIDQWQLLPGKE